MPNDDPNSMTVEQDGSLEAAAMNVPDFGGPDPSPMQTTTPRDERGRFKTEHLPAEADIIQMPRRNNPERPPIEALKPDAGAEGDPAVESAVGEEWFELPPEKEGAEPRRVKAEDVWTGYQERDALKAEIAELRRGTPPPVEYDKAIYQSVATRGRLIQMIEYYQDLMTPREPDRELLNPDSPRYNTELFYRQSTMYDEQRRMVGAAIGRKNQLLDEQQREHNAILAAKQARGRSQLLNAWPEMQQEAVQRQFLDDASRYWGIDAQTIDEVYDPRFFAMAKDALAFRNGQKAAQQAVKVVRGKPKLVKGAARSATDPRAGQLQSAMGRLSQSNSMEDAVAAVGALKF